MRPRASSDAFERRIKALVDELAHVCNDPELARMLATRGGLQPGDLPAFNHPRVFWTAVIRAAGNGQVTDGVQAIVDEAAKQYPANEVFAGYRTASEEEAEASSQTDGGSASPRPGSNPNGSFAQGTTYDVFVSHNGRDKPIVERLCRALLEAGVRPWFDKWDLAPGDVWMQEIERVLAQVPAVLVCVGAHGWSAWHEAERQAAVSRATGEGWGVVVPVLLPGAPEDVELPVFLRDRQWTDLRYGTVWEAEVARLVATLTGRPPRGPWIDEGRERPYRGLQPFTEADAGWMFGREQEEAKLLNALRDGERFIAVVGASGSGKSSLVRAGVVPAVRTGAVDGRQRWRALVMRPGTQPCQELALKLLDLQQEVEGTSTDLAREGDALEELGTRLRTSESRLSQTVDLLLGRRGRDDQLLLVVDQFEELFTAGAGRDTRENAPTEQGNDLDAAGTRLNAEGTGLLRNLLHATSAESGRVRVIITLRADFTGECLSVPALARQMERMHFALPPMEADQLREAIRRPTLRMGYDVDEALVDALVNATEDQPGRLPLLQHTLDLLWDVRDRQRQRLSYAAYHEHVGSVDESVAKRAEEVFAKLVAESAENEAAVRCVFLRLVHLGEGTGDTRRRVPRSELSGDATSHVLYRFIEARLLVTDDYRGVAGGQPEQAIEIAHEALIARWGRLRLWLDVNREAVRMRQEIDRAAREWYDHGRSPDELWRGSRVERAIEAMEDNGLELSKSERAFLEAGAAEEAEASRAREAALLADRDRLRRVAAVLLLASVVAGGSCFLALEARDEARGLARHNAELAERERLEAGRARRAAANEQGARASVLARIPGRELDALVLGVKSVTAPLMPLDDPADTRWLGLHDALTRARPIRVLAGHTAAVVSVDWSSDDQRIATASHDGTVGIWDTHTGELQAFLVENSMPVEIVRWAPDDHRIATTSVDGIVRIWNVQSESVEQSFAPLELVDPSLQWAADGLEKRPDSPISFSPDGETAVAAARGGVVEFSNGPTGRRTVALAGHSDEIRAIGWSHDGARFATAADDSTVRVWNASPLRPVELHGHSGVVEAIAWNPNGRLVATASDDQTVRLWDATTGRLVDTLEGHANPLGFVAWHPDGVVLASGDEEGSVRLWDGQTGAPLGILEGHTAAIGTLTWSADGSYLASCDEQGITRLWDGSTGEAHMVLGPPQSEMVPVLDWSGDDRIAVGTMAGTSEIWDGHTGRPLVRLTGHAGQILALAWSRDDAFLATSGLESYVVHIWDPRSGGVQAVLEGHSDIVESLAWSADRRLATAGDDALVRVWDGRTGALHLTLSGHTQPISRVMWSANDERLATGSDDGTVRVWDGRTGAGIAILEDHGGPVVAMAWSPDGRSMATAGLDHTAKLWTMTAEAWLTSACEILEASSGAVVWDAELDQACSNAWNQRSNNVP